MTFAVATGRNLRQPLGVLSVTFAVAADYNGTLNRRH